MTHYQISANNSTTLRYSKITWYSAINRGQIVGQFGVYNSTRVIFESELLTSAFTSILVKKGYYTRYLSKFEPGL